jgi:glutathione S-transferase
MGTTTATTSMYRFLYFDTRGAGEPIRYLLAMTGSPFQDIRYPLKASTKGFGVDSTFLRDQELGIFQSNMGKLPILQVIQDDGTIAVSLGQSYTILRFLATHHGAMGRHSLDAAYIDMIVECVRDIRTVWFKAKKEYEAKKDFLQKDLPEWCRKLEAALPAPLSSSSAAPSSSSSSSSPWLVGDKPSIADISVYALLATPMSIMTGSSESFFDGALAETIEPAYHPSTLGNGCPRLTQSVQAMSQLESIRKWERQRPDTFN